MTQITAEPAQVKSSGRAWLWPAIVIGILSVHTIGTLVVVFIATSDPSQAVVPDYHAKAMAWEGQQKQRALNDALGWTCAIETSLAADMLGQRSVRLSLRDAEGHRLVGAAVTLNTFHHARANDVTAADLNEAAPGEYVAMMDMRRDGLWAFNVQVQRDDVQFTALINQQVGPGRGSPASSGGKP